MICLAHSPTEDHTAPLFSNQPIMIGYKKLQQKKKLEPIQQFKSKQNVIKTKLQLCDTLKLTLITRLYPSTKPRYWFKKSKCKFNLHILVLLMPFHVKQVSCIINNNLYKA